MRRDLGVRLIGLAAALLACGSTGPLHVRAEADEAADFARYATFALAPPPKTAELPGYSESIGRKLEARVAAHLEERGLARASWDEADLQVALTIDGRTRVESWYFEQSVVAKAQGSAEVLTGSLRIDVVDRREERVVWQGLAWQETMERELGEEAGLRAVERLMARYPAR